MKDPDQKLTKRITVSVSQKLFDELDWRVEHSATNKSILIRNLIANWLAAKWAPGEKSKNTLFNTSTTEDGWAIKRMFK